VSRALGSGVQTPRHLRYGPALDLGLFASLPFVHRVQGRTASMRVPRAKPRRATASRAAGRRGTSLRRTVSGRRGVTSLSSPLCAPAHPARCSHTVATASVPLPHARQGRANLSQQSSPSVSRFSRVSPSTGPPQHHHNTAQQPGRAYTEHGRPQKAHRGIPPPAPAGCIPSPTNT
jgi:hypothetical protein